MANHGIERRVCGVVRVEWSNQCQWRWNIRCAQQRRPLVLMWNMAQSEQSTDWFAISIMLFAVYFKTSYCYDCCWFVFIFFACQLVPNKPKNKTVTTERAYAVLCVLLFLTIQRVQFYSCVHRFIFQLVFLLRTFPIKFFSLRNRNEKQKQTENLSGVAAVSFCGSRPVFIWNDQRNWCANVNFLFEIEVAIRRNNKKTQTAEPNEIRR